jgi:hypothetical protein
MRSGGMLGTRISSGTLQFYNIRHVQQHTGELCERLGAKGEVEVDWVGMQPAAAPGGESL